MARNPVSQLERFIPRNSPLGQAGGARMLLRVTGGNLAGAAALAAIARKESEFGRTSGRFRNNPYGWGVHLGPEVNTAPSIEAMSQRVWKGLNSGLYKGAGITTLPKILSKYAPPSENDTGLYQRQTAGWMRQMGVDPNTNIFQSGGSPPAAGPGAGTSSPAPESLQRVSGQLDAKRLMGILEAQRQRVLQGQMPAQNYQSELMKLASQALPRAQVVRNAQSVGGTAANAASTVAGAAADASSSQVVNAAKEHLGVPYSWGGGTPGGPSRGFGRGANTVGFDCSSLVQHAWAKVGVKIPRTTYEQIKVGRQINPGNRNAWRPGDLLFPSTGHVQMYVGGGKVIEAPRTGGHVQIVKPRSSYIAVRRPG